MPSSSGCGTQLTAEVVYRLDPGWIQVESMACLHNGLGVFEGREGRLVHQNIGAHGVRRDTDGVARVTQEQGLPLVHFSAQFERVVRDRGALRVYVEGIWDGFCVRNGSS